MRFHIPLHTSPSLKVTDVGRPHLRVQLTDYWAYLLEVGLVDDGDLLYTMLHKALPTHGYYSIRFDPTCWFGKFIRRLPLTHFLTFTMQVMYYNLWTRQTYFLQRRIRPHLLSKQKPVSLHKLMRYRLKLTTPSHQSTLLYFHLPISLHYLLLQLRFPQFPSSN